MAQQGGIQKNHMIALTTAAMIPMAPAKMPTRLMAAFEGSEAISKFTPSMVAVV